MSVGQVVQGALTDPAPNKHHKRAAGDARKEAQSGQHAHRAARDAKPGYEAFERAQQLESKQQGALGARLARDRSEAEGVALEGESLGSEPAGSSAGGTAVVANAGPAPSDSKAAASSTLSQGGPAPTAGNEIASAPPNPIADALIPARPALSSSTLPGSSEVEAAPATGPAVAVGQCVDTQLATSMQGDYAQHFGSVPVLVAGQLVELDLYSLAQKAGGTPATVRRLFLSLNSAGLGPVQISAESSQNRLSVSVAGASGAPPEVVHEQVRAVGELAARLGWKFEAVEHPAELPAEGSGAGGLDRLL